jgi:hypothetical protein
VEKTIRNILYKKSFWWFSIFLLIGWFHRLCDLMQKVAKKHCLWAVPGKVSLLLIRKFTVKTPKINQK